MRFSVIRFAIAALAMLALATSAGADAILVLTYGELAPPPGFATPVITSTTTAGTTTLTTPSTVPPLGTPAGGPGILVQIGTLGGFAFNQPAVLSFTTPVKSSANATISGGNITQDGFAGVIKFTSLAGLNLLTASFTSGGVVSGSGSAAALTASGPPSSVVFTSALIQPLLDTSALNSVTIGLSGVTPSLSISSNQLANFTAQTGGTLSITMIPEPGSVVMASIAVFAGLGCVGLRRFKTSHA